MSLKEDFFEEFEDEELSSPETIKEIAKDVTPNSAKELELVGNTNKPGPLTVENKVAETVKEIKEEINAKDQIETDSKPKENKKVVKSSGKKVTSSKVDDTKEVKELKNKISTLESKLEDLESKETIIVDVQNTDDRKKLTELIENGKYVLDDKKKPFILSEYIDAISLPSNPIIHKIYCDEVTKVSATRYYKDLENVGPESRELIKEVFWAHHKGYHSIDMITRDQVKYLIDNGFVSEKDLIVTYVDRSTSIAYTLNTDTIPTLEDILKEKERLISNWEVLRPKKRSNSLPQSLRLSDEELNAIRENEALESNG